MNHLSVIATLASILAAISFGIFIFLFGNKQFVLAAFFGANALFGTLSAIAHIIGQGGIKP